MSAGVGLVDLFYIGFVFRVSIVLVGFVLAFGVGLEIERGGELREFAIGLGFFVERLLEEGDHLFFAQELGVSAHGAVAGDFVVFDFLRGADEGGVANRRRGVFFDLFFAFGDEALHRLTRFALGRRIEEFHGAFEAGDVFVGLIEMLLEAGFQGFVGGGLRHFGEGLGELRFGVVEIAKFFDEEFVESGSLGHGNGG